MTLREAKERFREYVVRDADKRTDPLARRLPGSYGSRDYTAGMPFTASPPSHEAAEPIRQRQRASVADQPERGRNGHRGASCEAAATPADVSDRDLLTRFLKQQDEAAFRTLMERHSRLVLGVALRTLHDRHAAEDVLQATFLVFAQKARGIRPGPAEISSEGRTPAPSTSAPPCSAAYPR